MRNKLYRTKRQIEYTNLQRKQQQRKKTAQRILSSLRPLKGGFGSGALGKVNLRCVVHTFSKFGRRGTRGMCVTIGGGLMFIKFAKHRYFIASNPRPE